MARGIFNMARISQKAISHLLSRAALSPYDIFCHRYAEVRESPKFCWAYMRQCDEILFDNTLDAMDRAYVAAELARRVGDQHLKVAALCLVGTAYRVEGMLSKSESIYDDAENRAEGCGKCCLPNLFRRRGILRFYQHKFEESVGCYNRAIDIEKANKNLEGVGRVLVSRGVTYTEMGRHYEGLADQTMALSLFTTKTPFFFYVSGLVNKVAAIATIIKREGDYSTIEQAAQSMRDFRNHLGGLKMKYGFERVRAVMR